MTWTESARRELCGLPCPAQEAVIRVLDLYQQDPLHLHLGHAAGCTYVPVRLRGQWQVYYVLVAPDHDDTVVVGVLTGHYHPLH